MPDRLYRSPSLLGLNKRPLPIIRATHPESPATFLMIFSTHLAWLFLSGREDSNLRPLEPKSSALPTAPLPEFFPYQNSIFPIDSSITQNLSQRTLLNINLSSFPIILYPSTSGYCLPFRSKKELHDNSSNGMFLTGHT